MHFLGSQGFIFFCLQRYELLRGLGKKHDFKPKETKRQKGKEKKEKGKKRKKRKKEKKGKKKGDKEGNKKKEGKSWFLAHRGK